MRRQARWPSLSLATRSRSIIARGYKDKRREGTCFSAQAGTERFEVVNPSFQRKLESLCLADAGSEKWDSSFRWNDERKPQAAKFLTNLPAEALNRAICSSTSEKLFSTSSISLATFSVSWRIAAIVEDMESAASAVSSTAAVIIVTVWACISIALRMRSALTCTSSTVDWMESFASTVCLVAD